jgi:hypothetical protein
LGVTRTRSISATQKQTLIEWNYFPFLWATRIGVGHFLEGSRHGQARSLIAQGSEPPTIGITIEICPMAILNAQPNPIRAVLEMTE